MRYRIEHDTRLEFPSPVAEHQCEMRFTPRQDETQRVNKVELFVEPDAKLFQYTDAFGNRVHHFSVLEPHSTLVTRVVIDVESTLENPFNFPLLSPAQEREWSEEWFKLDPSALQYVLHESPQVRRLATLPFNGATPPERDDKSPVQYSLIRAMEWVSGFLSYQPGSTDTHSPLEDVVTKRAGVCQDFAHLMIAIARSWGLAARYVMGYVSPMNAAQLDGQASHAWAEVLIPGGGWRGFDPTHLLVVNDAYIAVAVGRDSTDAAPQRGSFKGLHANGQPGIRVLVTQHDQ